jgi:hypothetical protein
VVDMDSPMIQKFRTNGKVLGAARVVLTHTRGRGVKAIGGTSLYAPGGPSMPAGNYPADHDPMVSAECEQARLNR